MSGFRWVITSLWLPWSWRSFLYSSSVYSCHLLLISFTSVRSLQSIHYWAHLCMKCSLGISNFLEEISSFSHYIVFCYFSVLITENGFLISPCFLWNSTFKWLYLSFSPLPSLLFFSQLFVRPPQTIISPFCISFSLGWSWSLPPVQRHEPPSIVLLAMLSLLHLHIHFRIILNTQTHTHTHTNLLRFWSRLHWIYRLTWGELICLQYWVF